MLVSSVKTLSPKNYQRIVSTVPSLTELLCDLNLEKEVVGITKFCVHPTRWFRNKTRIGGTKNLQIEVIRQLSPDLIICNKEENTKKQVEQLAKTYDVLLTDINDLQSALDAISGIGLLTGRVEESQKIVFDIKSKFLQLAKVTAKRKKLRTAYLIWKEPYMAAGGGTFINDMMAYTGLTNTFADIKRYPETTFKEIYNRGCELILLSSEPYPFKQQNIPEIKNALRKTKIELVDGEMFSWYGTRLLKAADYFRSLSYSL